MAVRIVTDSSTNVPDDYLDRLGIFEVPAVITFGDQSYLNKVEMSLEAFYHRLETAERLPTTAQPSPEEFIKAYRKAAEAGAEAVVAVCVSAQLSGTVNSAVLAAQHADVPVHIWDTRHASLAAGWQSIAAAEMARAGRGVEAILEGLAQIRERVQMAFAPANLRFIIASGRVPKLRGTIGDLLNIKPVLAAADGRLEPVTQVRSQRRALEVMLERVAAAVGDRPLRLGVGHCNVPERAAEYLVAARERLNIAEGLVFELGPALAALGGPGLLGLAAYSLEA